ncbi:MAG: SusC/RagA family TonB-linked outer membrane protein [Prevotella sp.]|nr:SusC/RagA family TonB-linked outer membrane protein [Prevotella sp.]
MNKMRETIRKILVTLALALTCSAVVPLQAQAQADKRVTVNLVQVPLSDFFNAMRTQTGLNFIMKSSGKNNQRVTVNAKDRPAMQVISEALQQVGCMCEVEDGYVTVTDLPQLTGNRGAVKMRHITGFVTDGEGNPLPGAVVRFKGSKVGGVSSEQGFYDFTVPDGPVTLVFTYVGMTDKEVTFSGTGDVKKNVTLRSNTDIEEVVVTGYNMVERRKLTSSVTTLKAEDIMRPGISSIDQMLEGQVPDMIFMQNSGEVGTVPRLRIRGTSTLIGNREPLWVLDGVVLQDPVNVSPEELNDPDYVNRIGNAIAGINPQDIERIDVLKDASATALYGAKAANGVIVVTTKRGHVGKPLISYNMTASLKLRPRYTDRKIDLMNSQERVAFSKYLLQNGYNFGNNTDLVGYENIMQQFFNGGIDYNEVMKQTRELETMNTDWFDELTKDALSTSHSVSLSGGSENARYYGSVSYTRDNDVIRGNKNERYTMAMNVDANLSRIFSTQFGITGNVNKRKYNQSSLNPLDYAYNTSRAIPVYGADGDYAYYQRYNGTYGGYYAFNMLNELDNSYNQQEGNSLQANFQLQATITDWLKARLITAYQVSATDQESWWGDNTFYAASLRRTEYGVPAVSGDESTSYMPFGGELTQNRYRDNNYMARLQLDFNKFVDANKFHNLSATLGFEASSDKYKGSSLTSRGYYADRGRQFSATTLDDYPYYKSWLESNAYPTITDNLTNLVSAYALVSYSYKDFFTLTANARMDGSNKFGDRSNEKLLPIWSVSGNYNLSEHSFLKRDWIDFVMLKASFGYQGNMLEGQSPQMIIKQLPMDALYNELLSEVSIYPNPNLRWEKTQSWNVGLTFSVLDRRLQFEGEYYYKKTKDAFLLKDISSVNGISQYYVNSGDITNQGYSLSVTAVPVRTKDFSWTLATSYSKIFNELQTQPGQEQYELSNFLNGSALIESKPVGTFYSYKFLGLSPKDGSPLFDDGEEHAAELANMTKYQFYTSILEESGSREPTMSGTINNTLRYKQWRMNAVLNYSFGSKVRLFKMFNGTSYTPTQNINKELVGHWSKPGDELTTNIPNPTAMPTTHWSLRSGLPTIASNAFDEYNYGNHRVVSGNYMKLATLSLTYEFKRDLLAKWGLTRLALNLTGTNLYTFCSSKLKGQTPQQSGFSEIQLTDRPQYTFGLDIQF